MKKTLIVATLTLATAFGAIGGAAAQVAGTTTIGVSKTELVQLALGWSVKKSILGQHVYTEAGEKIGKVQDMIVTPDRSVSYLIVGAGGFVGIGRHDVAIPVSQVREQNGRIVMPGASKDIVQSMPAFAYADNDARREQFIAKTDQEIAKGKETLATLRTKAAAAKSDAKEKMDKHIATLQQDLKAAEDKLAEMKRAGAKKWKSFEAGVSSATDRMRKSLAAAIA